MQPRTIQPVRRIAGAAAALVLLSTVAKAESFTLSSPAFEDGGKVPRGYTCDGANQSPPLQWRGAPEGTQRFVLIVDDPDAPAGTWRHWTLYDLPAEVHELPRNVATSETLESGAKQGPNDFGKPGYGGPCPPPGKPHRYFFKLYALAKPSNLRPGANKAEVQRIVESKVLGKAQLMGIYGR